MAEPTDKDLQAETARLKLEKDRQDARDDLDKSAQVARKELAQARMEADAADAKARVGAIPAAPTINGSVTLSGDAGKGEVILLVARATNLAAERIVAALRPTMTGRRVALMQGADSVSCSNYLQFALQTRLLINQFERAGGEARSLERQADALAHPAPPPGVARPQDAPAPQAVVPELALAGAALDALVKIGGYFASSYDFSGFTLTTDSEQIVGALGRRLIDAGAAAVVLPGRSWPSPQAIEDALRALGERMRTADSEAVRLEAAAARAKAGASQAGDAGGPVAQAAGPFDAPPAPAQTYAAAKLGEASDLYAKAAAGRRDALAKADAYLATLGIADDKGVTPFAKIMREKAVYEVLTDADGLALFVDVRATVGGAFTRGSLWTFLSRTAPFNVMGGVVVSFTLTSASGEVRASGLVPVNTGYVRVEEVAALI